MKKRKSRAFKQKNRIKPGMKLSTKAVIISSVSFLLIVGLIFVFNLGDVRNAFAATLTTTQDGSWDDPATWGDAPPPTLSEVVTINHIVTITTDCGAARITINSGGALIGDDIPHTLAIDGGSGNDITVSGLLNAKGTTVKINKNCQLDGTGVIRFYKIDLNTKTLTVENTCTSTINLSGASDPLINPGTLTPGNASTICYNGTSEQLISGESKIKFNNLIINNSAGVTLQKNLTSSNLSGNLTLENGSILNNNGFSITGTTSKTIHVADGATFNVSGLTSAFSGFAASEFDLLSNVNYSGTTQTISAGRYGQLTLSNPGDKTLEGTVYVNELVLSEGNMVLNGNTLVITNASTSAISRTDGNIVSENTNNTSKIQWDIGTSTGSYTFPLSTTGGTYIPFTFNATSAGTGTGNITVSTYPTPSNNLPFPDGVTNINSNATDNSANTVDRFWQIDANSYTANPVATMTFTASPDETGLLTGLKAQRWNGLKWESPLANQTLNGYAVTVPNISSFSPWTLSGANSSVLPIDLLSFDASLNKTIVDINWTTASETNNHFFTIERSENGADFIKTGTVNGAGNSIVKRSYSLKDINSPSSIVYYRLKQTDYDGKYTYSPVIAVKNKKKKKEDALSLRYIGPNPFSDNFTVNYTTDKAGITRMELYNTKGELIQRENTESNPGNNRYRYDDHIGLATGIYILKMTDDEKSITARVFKN